jgi:hypothetical protein
MSLPLRRIVTAASLLALANSYVHAQCSDWSPGLEATAPDFATRTPLKAKQIASFDPGTGPQLFAFGADSTGLGSVGRWNGSKWEVVRENDNALSTFEHTTLAGTPVLVALGNGGSSGAFGVVHVFDGTTWSELPPAHFWITCATAHDDGTGSALYVGGFSSTFAGDFNVARWNGASWTDISYNAPGLFDGWLTSLVSFDDGSGPRLWAGMTAAANSVVDERTWRWNGTTWTPAGAFRARVNRFAVFNGQLYAGTTPYAAQPSGLYRWNGSAWSAIGPVAGDVRDLEVVDFGAGPRLALGGAAVTGLGGIPFANFALYDGTTIAAPAGGTPNGDVSTLAVARENGVTRVYAAGNFRAAGTIACDGLASTDVASWSAFGHGLDRPVYALAGRPAPGGGELHAAGLFSLAGIDGARKITASFVNGQWVDSGASLAASSASMNALATLDLGAGPELYGAGWFSGAQAISSANETTGVLRFNGTAWTRFAPDAGGAALCLTGFVDGSGNAQLVLGGYFPLAPAPSEGVVAWNGTSWNTFAGVPIGEVEALTTFDAGGGQQLYAAGRNTFGSSTSRVARWNGTSWTALGTNLQMPAEVHALCVYDAGGGPQLYAAGGFTEWNLNSPVLARWNGTAWTTMLPPALDMRINALCVHDDGRGPALYAAGIFSAIGGVAASNVARFDGAVWAPVAGGTDDMVFAMTSFDDDGDGDAELFLGGRFVTAGTVSSSRVARLEGCPHYASFCAGDGSLTDHATPCPCGNNGASGHGCANSADASGALLSASGSASADSIVLAGANMPANAAGVYLQHDALGDRVFGDGVACTGGNLIRLRNRTASGGASRFPDAALAQDSTTTLSRRGYVTPGSGVVRYYSLHYRNAASTFCPPADANVTNGVRVLW